MYQTMFRSDLCFLHHSCRYCSYTFCLCTHCSYTFMGILCDTASGWCYCCCFLFTCLFFPSLIIQTCCSLFFCTVSYFSPVGIDPVKLEPSVPHEVADNASQPVSYVIAVDNSKLSYLCSVSHLHVYWCSTQ